MREFHSNSNEIQDHVKQTRDLIVSPLENIGYPNTITVFLSDELFYCKPGDPWRVQDLLLTRPEWEKEILPLLKQAHEVFLFTHEWLLLLYNSTADRFRFKRCSPPVMDAARSCLLATSCLTFMMLGGIRELLEPIQFGQEVANHLSQHLKSRVNFEDKSDYRDLCVKMEQLVVEQKNESDVWKDRFFC